MNLFKSGCWCCLLLCLAPIVTTTDANNMSENTQNVMVLPLIPHHEQRKRLLNQGQGDRVRQHDNDRRRQLEVSQVGALYHGYGTHYLDLWVGTPPQRQTVIVDTGSSLTAFPCTGCKDCGAPDYHIDDYYDPDLSSTFVKTVCEEKKQCAMGMSYQEGSRWRAYSASDLVYVGGPHNTPLAASSNSVQDDLNPSYANQLAFHLHFGCQTSITGLFVTQLADGIMGMENSRSSFWKQMYDSEKIDTKSFSLCFSRPPEATREGTEAGAISMGGTDKRLHDTDMVWTSGAGSSGYFDLKIRQMYLRDGSGGDSAKSKNANAKVVPLDFSISSLNNGGVIVDSGTTDTYFDSIISDSFRQVFEDFAGVRYPTKKEELEMTPGELLTLPTILIQLVGDETMNQVFDKNIVGLSGDVDPENPYDVILAIPPSHYMEEVETGYYKARFYDTEGSGGVLGANAIMGHDVLFDVDNERLGWAESTCDYRKLVTDAGYPDVLDGDFGEMPTSQKEDSTATKTNTQGISDEQKKHPGGTTSGETPSDHASQNPIDDIEKTLELCSSLGCRAGATAAILLVLALCCCVLPRRLKSRQYQGYVAKAATELELSTEYRDDAPGDTVYLDDNFDDEHAHDDAEYGLSNGK